MNKELLDQLIKVVRNEMRQWKEQIIYSELEVFVGCILSDLKTAKIITPWEESILRQKLLEE